MTRIKMIMLMVIALSLIVPNVIASPLYDPDDIEAEGPVEAYVPATGVLTVNGITFFVNEDTTIITGRGRGTMVDLDNKVVGQWVSVNGYAGEDGTVIARKVRIKPWVNTEAESDDDPEDEDATIFRHPIALWLSTRFDLDYDQLMAMHKSGIGWGNIVKAYHLAKVNSNLGVSGEELLDMRLEGKGWGIITRELGTNPGNAPPAWGRDKDRDHPNPNAGPKH
jgi:hypothetical protein